MKYELRVWNDPEKIPPRLAPNEAQSRLAAIRDAARSAHDLAKEVARRNRQPAPGDNNPDILIDENSASEDAIKSAEVSYVLQDVKNAEGQTETVRAIKMNIQGNLYLPLNTSDGLVASAKSMVFGDEDGRKEENKRRDTLLLSQWASVKTPANNQRNDENGPTYYRAVALSILTKAGDFRLITAKNVYVESYSEKYAEGEFGTFELTLAQRVDQADQFKVDGLHGEKAGILDQIKGALKSNKVVKVAEAVATAGAVVKVGAAITKKGVETYEKFHGETEFTKRFKHGLDTAGSASDIANSGANIAKSIKNDKGADRIKNITDEVNKVNDTVNDDIQKGKDVYNRTPSVAEMEAAYLGYIKKYPDAYKDYLTKDAAGKKKMLEQFAKINDLEGVALGLIKADPAKYAEYVNASPEDKIKMLEEYAQKAADRAKITKYYEESQIDPDKVDKTEKDLSDGVLDGKDHGKPLDTPTTPTTAPPTPTVIPIPIPTPMPIPMPTPTPTPNNNPTPTKPPAKDTTPPAKNE